MHSLSDWNCEPHVGHGHGGGHHGGGFRHGDFAVWETEPTVVVVDEPDDEWPPYVYHRYVAGSELVPYVGADPTLTGMASTKQAIEELSVDMKTRMSLLDPSTKAYTDQVNLFVQFDMFHQEFDGWYAVATDPEYTSDVGSSLLNYQNRYRQFRSRFSDIGGRPSSDLVVDEPPDSGSTSNWKIWALLVGGAILMIIVLKGASTLLKGIR